MFEFIFGCKVDNQVFYFPTFGWIGAQGNYNYQKISMLIIISFIYLHVNINMSDMIHETSFE